MRLAADSRLPSSASGMVACCFRLAPWRRDVSSISTSMQAWTNLARLALIGTEHQPPPPTALGDGSLDGVLAAFDPAEERESYLLKTGAALTLAKRAGHKPGVKASALAVAPPEVQPRCPSAAGQDLARMLRDYLPQVLPEWLELAEKLGVRAPEDLLPDLLDHAKGKTELRARVRQIIGQRGAWLAAQNSDWSFAIRTGGDEKIWQEGKRAERVATLREIREVNPGRARELLGATWKDEGADDRADFVQALRVGLSLEDEPFLETALDDRRKEVRIHAISHLSSLPGSKLVQFLTERATPLLHAKKQLLRGVALEVTLPTECTKEMKRYGVGSSTPVKDVGEKALWLQDMLQAIPPNHWSQSFGLNPKELIQAAIKSEWSKPLLTGWSSALGRHHDQAWLEAWMEAALAHEPLLDYLPRSAVNRLSTDDLEGLLTKLYIKDKAVFTSERVVSFRVMRPGPWSEALSSRLLAEAQHNVTQYGGDYSARARWQNLLRAISLNIAPQFAAATSGWPKEMEANNVREVIDEFCAVIEFRRSMHRHFKGEK